MTRIDLVASLKQIRTLAADCLGVLENSVASPVDLKDRASAKKSLPARTLPERISHLRDSGFFAAPRTARGVQEKLASSYPCEVDRIAMALLRLNERKNLRKASKVVDGKKQVAYVW